MSPYQHGEVYVTEDGAETDLDLGHYERFTGLTMSKSSNVTAGKIYQSVIEYTGAKAVPIPLREENGFAFDAAEVIDMITPATRLLIVNSPANPTGGVVPRAEFDRLAKGPMPLPGV